VSHPTFSPQVHASRREKLRAAMREAGHRALLVSHAANRFYLSGFELSDSQCNESSGMLLITTDGKEKLLTDPRYLDAARRLWPEEDIFIYTGQRAQQIRDFVAGVHPGQIAFESQAMSVDNWEALRETLPLTPTKGLVEGLRRFKEPAEIELLERSCQVNEKVMRAVPDVLVPGRSEGEVAWRLEQLFRDFGATEMAFSPIVAVDKNAALPHAEPGRDQIAEECMVLVDMGGRYGDYNSDQTRTFWVGARPPDHFRRALELTQMAQAKAIDIIRPGLPIKDAYRAARAYFEEHGVAAAFTHALGHGIGLETHEFPSLSPLAEGALMPGMVVTVEPGLYYPEWGGIRWEYMVAVTEDGCRILGQDG
jgi:Xaa-Pro aminopeptidase